jgi:hypothetical protein
VSSRKKKLFLIQLTIFLVASTLLYNTYRDTNEVKEDFEKIEVESSPDTNLFRDIEYSGFDFNGNRYVLKAEQAEFKTVKPELISMKNLDAKFYLKDGTILTVISDTGLYNNITLDIDFRKNVKADYLTYTLFSDLLSYSNSNGKLISTGNVQGNSVDRGEFSADNVEYNFKNKTLNFSMFSKERVNVKIKN